MKENTDAATVPQLKTTVTDFFSDVKNIRVDASMADGPATTKLPNPKVRKPSKEWFVRVHPDPAYSLDVLTLELKEDGEIYLVPPAMRDALAGESCVHFKRLRLAMNRQADLIVWPINLPRGGKTNDWNESALQAANLATREWVRLSPNLRLGAYDISVANLTDDPCWPVEPFNDLLRIAFKGRLIDTMDHPVLKRLRGEV